MQNNDSNSRPRIKASERRAQAKAADTRPKFGTDIDPVAAGRKGGNARREALTPERRAEIARNAQAKMIEKVHKKLLGLTRPALIALEEILSDKNHPGRLGALKTIFDRTGFGPKSAIEIEGALTHSGELIHRHQCLDVDRLPLIIKRMMAAAIESDWTPSPALIDAIKAELPMLQVKVESNKGSKPAGSNGAALGNGAALARRAITPGVITQAAYNQVTTPDQDDDDIDTDQDDNDPFNQEDAN